MNNQKVKEAEKKEKVDDRVLVYNCKNKAGYIKVIAVDNDTYLKTYHSYAGGPDSTPYRQKVVKLPKVSFDGKEPIKNMMEFFNDLLKNRGYVFRGTRKVTE